MATSQTATAAENDCQDAINKADRVIKEQDSLIKIQDEQIKTQADALSQAQKGYEFYKARSESQSTQIWIVGAAALVGGFLLNSSLGKR